MIFSGEVSFSLINSLFIVKYSEITSEIGRMECTDALIEIDHVDYLMTAIMHISLLMAY